MGKASAQQTDLKVSATARGFRTAAARQDARSEACSSRPARIIWRMRPLRAAVLGMAVGGTGEPPQGARWPGRCDRVAWSGGAYEHHALLADRIPRANFVGIPRRDFDCDFDSAVQ